MTSTPALTAGPGLLAAGAAALAAALLVRPVTSGGLRSRPRRPPGGRSRRMLGAVVVGPAVVVAGATWAPWISTRTAVVALLAAAVALAGRALWSRRQRRRAVEAGQRRVLDFCQQLAAELGAGQPPGSALERAARGAPGLAPVAQAFLLGGDVPSALREAGSEPGHQDLHLAAAAWQVAHRSGGGLSAALLRVAAGLRATQATRRVVRAELASARATARLMAGLPVLALLMGSGIGGDPIGFLLGSPWGLACLAAGLALEFAGLWWIEAIADAVAAGLT